MHLDIDLPTLCTGVRSIENTDGFPLESNPPQGQVKITFGNGATAEARANVHEYEAARKMLNPDTETPSPTECIPGQFLKDGSS